MSCFQPGIPADETPRARYLTFTLRPGSETGAVLQRRLDLIDGITDGFFSFTHPVTGSDFWRPPVSGDDIDLSAIGR